MTTEADLIEAILAAPEDPAPRHVYADWLSERGDPRGERLAAQLLFDEHTKSKDFDSERYRTAFVALRRLGDRVPLPWEDTIEASLEEPEPLPRTPVRVVKVYAMEPTTIGHLRALAPYPPLVQTISLTEGEIGRVDLAREIIDAEAADEDEIWPSSLPAPPFSDFVRGLHLRQTTPGFPDQPFPAGLRKLSIPAGYGEWPVELVPALAGCPQLQSLACGQWPAAAVADLFQRWPFERLESLMIQGPQGGTMLPEDLPAATARSLVTLFLTQATEADAARWLADAKLEHLSAAGGILPFGADVIRAPLRQLQVSYTQLDDIIDRLPSTLQELRVITTSLDDAMAARIADDPRMARLLVFELVNVLMSSSARARLEKSPFLRQIPFFSCESAP